MKLFVVEAQQQQGYVALLAVEHPVVRMPNQKLASEVDWTSLLEVAVTDLAVELLGVAVMGWASEQSVGVVATGLVVELLAEGVHLARVPIVGERGYLQPVRVEAIFHSLHHQR